MIYLLVKLASTLYRVKTSKAISDIIQGNTNITLN